MKHRTILKLLVSFLFLFCGCSSMQDFSKRKYMPGFFSEKNNVQPGKVLVDNSKLPVSTLEIPVIASAGKTVARVQPVNGDMHLTPVTATETADRSSDTLKPRKGKRANNKEPQTVEQGDYYSTGNHYYKGGDNLERISKMALIFGVIGIFWAIPFSIIALIQANRVLSSPHATHQQFSRAKSGRDLSIAALVLRLVAYVLVIVLLFVLLY